MLFRSASYTLAVALHQGQVGLADFDGDCAQRPEIRRLMDRITIQTEPDAGKDRVGVDHGSVHVRLRKGNETLAETSVAAHPGSPSDPATPAEIGDKIADCLDKYRRDGGVPPTAEAFRQDLRIRLHLPSLQGSKDTDARSPHSRHNQQENGASAVNPSTV